MVSVTYEEHHPWSATHLLLPPALQMGPDTANVKSSHVARSQTDAHPGRNGSESGGGLGNTDFLGNDENVSVDKGVS